MIASRRAAFVVKAYQNADQDEIASPETDIQQDRESIFS